MRARAIRLGLAAGAGLAALIAAVAVALAARSHQPAGPPPPRATQIATIGGPDASPAIPPGFIGLSLEYQSVADEAGEGSGSLDTVFAQLIRNLNPGQRPVLRIGGDSTDHTWVPASGVPHLPGLTFALRPAWLGAMRLLVKRLDAKVTPGIDLEANSPRLASVESRALLRALGTSHVVSFEIGNEPSLYGAFAWYRTPSGENVPGRPPGWDAREYVEDLTRIASALPRTVALTGPALGGAAWMPVVVPALAREDPRLTTVTYHAYPLVRCFSKPGSPKYPTIPHLLSPSSSRGLAAFVAPFAREARHLGRAFRVDELNSVACEGKVGVSNTFASSLWMLDTLFAMANTGVSGVNVHTFPTGAYRLFAFSHAGGRWSSDVAPEYYGMLMFAEAAPPGSRLLATHSSGSTQVRVWSTRASNGTLRVVLINDSDRRAQVLVRSSNLADGGTVERLEAPALSATDNVTLGGRGYGPRTTTGILRPRQEVAVRTSRGYSVTVPADSAAMLTVPAG